VIDFDVGLRNLDLVMGPSAASSSTSSIVSKGRQAFAGSDPRHGDWRRCGCCRLRSPGQDALTEVGELRASSKKCAASSTGSFAISGRHRARRNSAMRFADAAIIVTTIRKVSSVRDSDRIIGLLDLQDREAEKSDRIEKHHPHYPLRSTTRSARENAHDR